MTDLMPARTAAAVADPSQPDLHTVVVVNPWAKPILAVTLLDTALAIATGAAAASDSSHTTTVLTAAVAGFVLLVALRMLWQRYENRPPQWVFHIAKETHQ